MKADLNSSVLILLDLSAVSDTINHQILLTTQSTSSSHWCSSDLLLDPSSSPHTLHHWLPSYRHMASPTIATLMTHSSISLFNQMIQVRNLGVIFDDQLSFKEHIAKTARSCRFALHNIRKIRPFLTEHAAQLLVQALVISRLDYGNALLAGLPSNTIKPLQMIQNAAARLVFNEPKRAHVTPLFDSLHWLLVAPCIKLVLI